MRVLRRMLAVTLGLGIVAASAPAASAAGPIDPTTFVACGIGGTSPGGDTCLTLPEALAAATANIGASAGPSTIILRPGTYCPIDIPQMYHDLYISGSGTMAGGGSFTGPEAGLSVFRYDSRCGTAPSAMIQDSNSDYGKIFLQNLTVDGTGANGPGTGIDLTTLPGFGGGLYLRDAEVDGFAAYGVKFQGEGLQVHTSALLDNTVGLYAIGSGNVEYTTIAGSSSQGVLMDGSIGYYNNTITHNKYGVYISGYGNEAWAFNNIVADNTTADCAGTVGYGGDWEYASGHGSGGTNLVGSTCQTNYVSDDIVYSGAGLPQPQLNGGPTRSVMPPEQALAKGTAGACHVGGSDQRDGTPGATCDIGSVDTSSSLVPDLTAQPIDVGQVVVGQDSGGATTLYQQGGGLVSIGQATVSGAGFSLVSDTCTWHPLSRQYGSCFVGIEAHPTATGPMSGTLTIPTTGGDVTVPLHATAVPPPDPSALTAPAGSSQPYGATPTLTGTLTDSATSSPVPGASVDLLVRNSGSSVWRQVTTATSDSQGKVSVKLAPLTRIASYEWSYAGDQSHDPVTSTAGKIVVAPVVHATLLHAKVHHGHLAKVGGTLTPSLAGITVTLQRKTSSGWKTADTDVVRLQTLPDGRHTTGFSLQWKPSTTGPAKLRVAVPQTHGLASTHSSVLAVTVT